MKKILATLLVFISLMAFADLREVSESAVKESLADLDKRVANRDMYVERRNRYIDSLKSIYNKSHDASLDDRLDMMMKIGEAYTAFNNDSAITIYDRAIALSETPKQSTRFKIKRATLLPLAGLNAMAVNDFEEINPDSIDEADRALYYESARQMYSYIAAYFDDYPQYAQEWNQRALEAQSKLLELDDKSTDLYKLNLGEYMYHTGDKGKAKAILTEVVASQPIESNTRARAAHILSSIARDQGKDSEWLYYLIQAAISDVTTATLEGLALQDLGVSLYEKGDVDRAYIYLSTALDNAVACKASMRMLTTAKALPVISRAHKDKLDQWRTKMYWIVGILILLAIILLGVLFFLRREIKREIGLKDKLKDANQIKEVYISRFLSLCSIYMDKLNQLSGIVQRKISAGQVDDLLRMTQSGKFIEEQSREFYNVFDEAFLHIYPSFVESVNQLLKPDCQIELRNDEMLNTELRILAFMRLGIEDTQRISQVLNYSVNTIYTYRNKLKGKALNRETFEHDIMQIGTEK